MPSTQDCQGVARALMAVAADPSRTDELYGVLGEFCHGIRDRLNALKISLYVANQSRAPEYGRSWAEIHEQYLEVEQFVDQFQTVFRPMSLSLLSVALGRMIDENRERWERLMQSKGVNLFWSRPKNDPIGTFDAMRLTDALDRFIHCRAEHLPTGTMVAVSWTTEGDRYRLSWEERPPAKSRPNPATPPDAECPTGNMALLVLVRVMALHGGIVSVRSGEGCGLELRWPITVREAAEASRAVRFDEAETLMTRER